DANRADATQPPRNVSRVKTGFETGTVARPPQNAAAATRRITGIATSNGVRRRAAGAAPTAASTPAEDDTVESASRPNATSRAESKRSAGFFSRQWRTIRSIAGGTARFSSEISGGSSFRIALIASADVSPLNARLPESDSNKIAPSEKISER